MMNSDVPTASDVPSLAEAYARLFPIGVALEPTSLQESGPLVAHHFRRLTAENAMKFGELSRTQGSYDFTRADAIANFARQHSMPMTGHTLVWHQMTPPWLFEPSGQAVSRGTVEHNLRRHIFTMVERYADVVDNWDVVNEAVSDNPNKLWRDASEGSLWHSVFEGESYVAKAFADATDAAAQFAPNVKLYYNDYNLENRDKRRRTLELIRRLRSEGVRIDGVGVQGHLNMNWPSRDELVDTVEEIAAEGLLVKVSELDISVYCKDDPNRKIFEPEVEKTPKLDRALAARYQDVFSALKACASKLTSVTFWCLSDRSSWLNYWPLKRKNYPLLFDAQERPKESFRAVLDVAR